MKMCKEKVWKTADGRLVPDGHKDAAFLVATAGQNFPDKYAEQFDGHEDFFVDVNRELSESNNIPAHGTDSEPGDSNQRAAARRKSERKGKSDPEGKDETVITKSSKGEKE